MCLYVDGNLTKKMLKKLENRKTVTFYKNFFKLRTFIFSPYMNYKIKIGDTSVHRELGKIDIFDNSIYWGCFHAYTNSRNICYPVEVRVKDIVKFGINNDVCFKAFRIKNWNRCKR